MLGLYRCIIAPMTYDAIIVGAGPAGMMAAYYLKEHRILIIEKGADLHKRAHAIRQSESFQYDAEVEGIAGAGGWSDGKLCLGPVGILDDYLTANYANETATINALFMEVLGDSYKQPDDTAGELSLDENITQEVTPVANLGIFVVRRAFEKIQDEIVKSGATIITEDSARAITKDHDIFKVVTESGKTFAAKHVIVATGKCDLALMPELIRQFGLSTVPAIPTIGVRLIVPREQLRDMKALGSNPKLRVTLKNGDTIKTHCFAFGGEAMTYMYGDNVLVGGRADSDHLTDYATVAVLYKFAGTPVAERKHITRDMLAEVRSDHPGKAIYQDLLSFMAEDMPLQTGEAPRIKRSEPGDLRLYFPDHILAEIRHFIQVLMQTYHMDVHGATVVGPAAEWLNDTVQTLLTMETSVSGLYMVGDASGITQGIIASSVAGYRAAQDINSRLG